MKNADLGSLKAYMLHLDNSFQNWKNLVAHVPRCFILTNSKKNPSYMLLVNFPQNTVQFPALGTFWFHPGLGEMSKMLILTVLMEVNML